MFWEVPESLNYEELYWKRCKEMQTPSLDLQPSKTVSSDCMDYMFKFKGRN